MSHKRRDGAEKRREDESYKSISCSDVVEVFPEETSIERHKNGSILFLQDKTQDEESSSSLISLQSSLPKNPMCHTLPSLSYFFQTWRGEATKSSTHFAKTIQDHYIRETTSVYIFSSPTISTTIDWQALAIVFSFIILRKVALSHRHRLSLTNKRTVILGWTMTGESLIYTILIIRLTNGFFCRISYFFTKMPSTGLVSSNCLKSRGWDFSKYSCQKETHPGLQWCLYHRSYSESGESKLVSWLDISKWSRMPSVSYSRRQLSRQDMCNFESL